MKLNASLIVAAFAAVSAVPAAATTINLAGDGTWQTFNVSDIDALSGGLEWIDNNNSLDPNFGTPLSFEFTIADGMTGVFTVVDAGFAGDTFIVRNNGGFLGSGHTLNVPQTTFDMAPFAFDFDVALLDPVNFSQGIFQLGAGSYSITGLLDRSVLLDPTTPLNSTLGGVRLSIMPVPEPGALLAMLAGFGVLAGTAGRARRRGNAAGTGEVA